MTFEQVLLILITPVSALALAGFAIALQRCSPKPRAAGATEDLAAWDDAGLRQEFVRIHSEISAMAAANEALAATLKEDSGRLAAAGRTSVFVRYALRKTQAHDPRPHPHIARALHSS